jgi:hypothetical protein
MRKLLLVFALGSVLAPSAHAVEIWLTGVQPQPGQPINQPYDNLAMFQPNAPWQGASQSIRVFKTTTQWLLTAPDDSLVTMFSDLDRRGIALGVEALMMSQITACGFGVEGYSSPGTVKQVADRVKRLGGNLQYVAMDEPLTFGHLATGPNTCQSSISDLAAALAINVAAIRADFPAAKIGDIELLDANTPLDQIIQFAAAYQSATGTPLDFLHIDINWAAPSWVTSLRQLVVLLHNSKIKVGFIYNGGGLANSDVAWTQQAEQYFATIEADPTMIPDDAIFQTWMSYPTHVMPETQAGTMTYLVRRYTAALSGP